MVCELLGPRRTPKTHLKWHKMLAYPFCRFGFHRVLQSLLEDTGASVDRADQRFETSLYPLCIGVIVHLVEGCQVASGQDEITCSWEIALCSEFIHPGESCQSHNTGCAVQVTKVSEQSWCPPVNVW